ncbi:hypothetical protein EH223_08495 [candidate division KSB1 bacterium]|nr:MAG: hypothetical protein EH223_08495 [candidate division KSB1 bacterium]
MQADKAIAAQEALAKGTSSNYGVINDTPFYDTALCAVATTEHRLFSSGIGKPFTGAAVTKMKCDTNLTSEGIGNTERFRVKGIGISYYCISIVTNQTLLDILDTLNNTVVEFFVNNKPSQFTAPLSLVMGMNFNVVHLPTVAGDNVNSHVHSSGKAFYPINSDIVLAANTKYEVIMTHTAATVAAQAGDKIRVTLAGLWERLL